MDRKREEEVGGGGQRSRWRTPSAQPERPPGGAALDREEGRKGNGERERGGKEKEK